MVNQVPPEREHRLLASEKSIWPRLTVSKAVNCHIHHEAKICPPAEIWFYDVEYHVLGQLYLIPQVHLRSDSEPGVDTIRICLEHHNGCLQYFFIWIQFDHMKLCEKPSQLLLLETLWILKLVPWRKVFRTILSRSESVAGARVNSRTRLLHIVLICQCQLSPRSHYFSWSWVSVRKQVKLYELLDFNMHCVRIDNQH